MSEAGGLRHRCTPSPTTKKILKIPKKNFRKKFSTSKNGGGEEVQKIKF
jgi:hypothetical protein